MKTKVGKEGPQNSTDVHIPVEVLDVIAGAIADRIVERLRPLLPPRTTRRGGSGFESER